MSSISLNKAEQEDGFVVMVTPPTEAGVKQSKEASFSKVNSLYDVYCCR